MPSVDYRVTPRHRISNRRQSAIANIDVANNPRLTSHNPSTFQKVALATEPFSPAAQTIRVPRTTDSVWKPGPLNGDQVRPPSLE